MAIPAPWLFCFNVAAPDLARMERRRNADAYERCASMWPRLIWRGWSSPS